MKSEEPSGGGPHPESRDTAQLMGILVGILVRRLQTGMPELLEVLGPSWIQSRLNVHRLVPVLDSLINQFAERDRRYVRETLTSNADLFADWHRRNGKALPPVSDPPPEVIQLIADLRSIVADFDFKVLSQCPPEIPPPPPSTTSDPASPPERP